MSITPVFLVLSILAVIAHLFKSYRSSFFIFSVILFLLLISSDQVGDIFFSPEQEGHYYEAVTHIDNACNSISLFSLEFLKKAFMYSSCVFKSPGLFDFLFKFSFSIIVAAIFFNLKNKKELQMPFLMVSLLLLPSLIYGNIRTPLAQVILIGGVLLYLHTPIKIYIVTFIASFPHSVGILSIFYIYSLKFKQGIGNNYNIFFFFLALIFALFVYFQYQNFTSGESMYIFGKNASVYLDMGASNTKQILDLPRSIFALPTLVLLISIFFKNLLLNRKAIVFFYIATLFLALSGALISIQVSARFVGFVVPLYFLIFSLFYSSKSSNAQILRIVKLIVFLFYLIKSYYDSFRIEYAIEIDYFGLPYIETILF